ncbi:MAG: aegerolysin family protein [Minicystis sp.]
MSTRVIENIAFIGHCYDPVYLDRTRLTDTEPPDTGRRSGAKIATPFEVTVDPTLNATVPDATKKVPHGETVIEEEFNLISSSYEYAQKVSTSVGVNVEAESVFTASASIEWENIKKSLEERETSSLITTGMYRMFSLVVDMQQSPRLTQRFKDALLAMANQNDDAAFDTFAEAHGTHFAARVVLGGMFEQRIDIKNTTLTSFESNNVNVKREASVTLDGITAGTSIDNNTEVSSTWKTFYKQEKRRVSMTGGEPSVGKDGEALGEWLKTVNASTAAVIQVSLVPHATLFTAAYYPKLSQSERDKARATIESLTTRYFAAHGLNLGASRVFGGDVICIVPLDPQAPGGPVSQAPPMLAQPRGAADQVAVQTLVGSSLGDFKRNGLKEARYRPYLWRVDIVGGNKPNAQIKPDTKFKLVNLESGRAMNSQAALPTRGVVSAGSEIKPPSVDGYGNASDVWTMEWRYDESTGAQPSIVFNDGGRVAVYRKFEDGNPRDPAGCIRIWEKKAYSNGSNKLTAALLLNNYCGFQIIKVDQPEVRLGMNEDKETTDMDGELLRAEKCQAHIYIENMTSFELRPTGYKLDWGKLIEGPHTIEGWAPTKIGFKAQGRANTATGTEGKVWWKVLDDETTLEVYFDIPYSKKNKGSVSVSGPNAHRLTATLQGPHPTGDVGTFIVRVTEK